MEATLERSSARYHGNSVTNIYLSFAFFDEQAKARQGKDGKAGRRADKLVKDEKMFASRSPFSPLPSSVGRSVRER